MSEQREPRKTDWDRLQERRAEEDRPRFSAVMWIGFVILIVGIGALGVYSLRDTLFVSSAPTPTPRPIATPTPRQEATPVPTPAPDAWAWVGCDPEAACANELISREEMASFLVSALDLSPIEDHDAFADIADSPYRAYINAAAAAGLTSGCASTQFCPEGQVTREQMATFVRRAFDLPATTRDFFTDDEDSSHEAAINAVAAAGIATNCGERLFCPRDFVTRGEVAGYLSRALDL